MVVGQRVHLGGKTQQRRIIITNMPCAWVSVSLTNGSVQKSGQTGPTGGVLGQVSHSPILFLNLVQAKHLKVQVLHPSKTLIFFSS